MGIISSNHFDIDSQLLDLDMDLEPDQPQQIIDSVEDIELSQDDDACISEVHTIVNESTTLIPNNQVNEKKKPSIKLSQLKISHKNDGRLILDS